MTHDTLSTVNTASPVENDTSANAETSVADTPFDPFTPEISPVVEPRTLAEFGQEKMLDLYYHHDHEVGSELYKLDPEAYAGYEPTNCITYVMKSLSYAFQKSGHPDAAREVWKYITRGVDLANYLVHTHGWSCIYANPDQYHPEDGDSEHTYSNYIVNKYCTYYGLPVMGVVRDYRPTPTGPGTLYEDASPTPENTLDLMLLNRIRFGFGLSRGGTHTWLFSQGWVFEVHWTGIGDTLYERTPLRDFPWLSNLIVIPPEEARKVQDAGLTLCGRRH